MLATFSARDLGVLRWLGVVLSWGALLLLVPLPSGATDVCALTGTALRAELEPGAAQIAEAYAKTALGMASGGNPIERACNWTCGSGPVITPMRNAFGFLQYNCSSTTAPPGTRRRTGTKTDSEMGLSITDDEYRKEADKIFRSASTGVGDLMRVPPSLEIVSRDGDVKKLTDAVEAIPGATWMKFSSTSVVNVGADGITRDGPARVLIRVPDSQNPPRFEQWIQIAIKDSTGKLGRNVDFLAVQLRPDATSPTVPTVAFRGYSRTTSGFVLEGPRSGFPLTKCYSCHTSGLRAVIPAPAGARAAGRSVEGTMLTGPDIASQLAHIKDITSQVGVFGPTGYTASLNGPPLGPSTQPGRAEFVEKGFPARPPNRAKVPGCAAGLSAPRRQEIVNRMDCQLCHDGKERGILNAGTNLRTIRHKVVENTVAPMPPDVTGPDGLTPSERKVLFECLQAEYAEILQKWLTSDLLIVP
jgi:hypothetical protein